MSDTVTLSRDLVKRLRETASNGVSVWGDLQMEAAKEIEILTAERELYASAMDRMKAALAAPQPMSFNTFVRQNYEDLGAGVYVEKPEPQPVKQALIDAAPALYEALKGFYNNSIAADWPDDIYNNAKAALALVGEQT